MRTSKFKRGRRGVGLVLHRCTYDAYSKTVTRLALGLILTSGFYASVDSLRYDDVQTAGSDERETSKSKSKTKQRGRKRKKRSGFGRTESGGRECRFRG